MPTGLNFLEDRDLVVCCDSVGIILLFLLHLTQVYMDTSSKNTLPNARWYGYLKEHAPSQTAAKEQAHAGGLAGRYQAPSPAVLLRVHLRWPLKV